MKAIESFTWSVNEGFLESGGMILLVTLRSPYALVWHLCLIGLPEVAMPYSDTCQDCRITFLHTRPCCRSVDPQTLHGNVHQVDHMPSGPTISATRTTMLPLRLYGGKPLVVVTRDRRYGPSWLCVNDDDDCEIALKAVLGQKNSVPSEWGRKMAVLGGSGGLNVKLWVRGPEKAHPCVEPHFLTFLASTSVWVSWL